MAAVAVVAGTLIPVATALPANAQPVSAAPAAPSAPAAPASKYTGLGIRIVDGPSNNQDDPRAKTYIVDRLAPGTVIHRRIEVTDDSPDPMQVLLYSAAASINAGSFLGAGGRTPNELSTWTSIDPVEISLAPGAKQMTTVTVNVAKDAAPGERYAILWAQLRPPPQKTGAITQVSRVGIRMYVSVGPGNAPPTNSTITTLTAGRAADGRPTVSAQVHNTGGRAIDLSGSLQLSNGPDGLSTAAFPVNLGTTIAIGGTEPTTTMLNKSLPAGPWTATMTLHSGLVEVTEKATLTFPAAGLAAPVAAVIVPVASSGSSTPEWLYPAIIAAVVVLLLAIFLWFILARRRKKDRDE